MALFSGLNTRLRPLRKVWRWTSAHLPEPNFITLHYLYFILTTLISGIIFWGSSTPPRSVRFIDSIFLTVSAMTEAGLNTVNLSTLNTWQQVILFLLIMLGSAIWVSAFVVHVRRKAFESRFLQELEREKRLQKRRFRFPLSKTVSRADSPLPYVEPKTVPLGATIDTLTEAPVLRNSIDISSLERNNDSGEAGAHDPRELDADAAVDPLYEIPEGRVPEAASQANGNSITTPDATTNTKTPNADPSSGQTRPDRITFTPETRFRRRVIEGDGGLGQSDMHRLFSFQGVGARNDVPVRRMSLQSPRLPPSEMSRMSEDRSDFGRRSYMPASGGIARNSTFHDLTEEDRERLGGTEYKAIVFLSWIVPIYFVLWQFLGCLACGAYVKNYHASTTEEDGINPFWTGAFNAVSAFNNSGMSLLDANMTAFQTSIYLLLTMGLLILAGNTMYPVFLRWIILAIHFLLPRSEEWSDARVTLQFLLDHPRRCYTNLFPAKHTWWLVGSVFVLNGVDTIMFVVLNVRNPNTR